MHIGIIMDGNGRWATRRGLARTAGHRAGAKALAAIVEAAPGLGVEQLTAFAFSSDNWRRPPQEVRALMALLRGRLREETERHADTGVRVSFLGRRDRLPADLVAQMARAEAATAGGARLHLRVAIDYSARDAILAALGRGFAGLSRDGFGRLLSPTPDSPPDVDLLIRTGGEKRLSDFLLWECAYAEFAFLDAMWPDFTPAALAAVLDDFSRRERRFGGLAPALASA